VWIGEIRMKATTVRVNDNTLEHVDGLAKALNRSRSWVINKAIDRFLECEEGFIPEVQEGQAEVERGELASHEAAVAKFRKWGVDAS
jgi:predicted transcriptional regulator